MQPYIVTAANILRTPGEKEVIALVTLTIVFSTYMHVCWYCSQLAGLSVQNELKHSRCNEAAMSSTNNILGTYIKYKLFIYKIKRLARQRTCQKR